MQAITVMDQHVVILVGKSAELKIGVGSPKSNLWVRRDLKWVPTIIAGPRQIKYLQLTNVCDRKLILLQG